MRKHFSLFILYVAFLPLLKAQLDTGKYILKEQGYEYSLKLQEDSWFEFESGGFTCECVRFTNGYYFFVSDTLILSHVPIKGYGEKSRYEIENNWKGNGDSIRITLQVFDFNEKIYSGVVFTALEQDLSEKLPVLSKQVVFENQKSNDRGEVNFVLPKNWRGEITNFQLGVKRVNIPVDEWTQNTRYKVFIAPNAPSLHTYYNSEFSIEKWLIIKNKSGVRLKRIGGDKELTLSRLK